MQLRQYKLRSQEGQEQVVWLEDGRAHVGSLVTLKDSDDPTKFWRIEEAYSAQDGKDLKRGWNNNI